MNERILSDSTLSRATREDEWTIAGHAESPGYLLPPALALLKSMFVSGVKPG